MPEQVMRLSPREFNIMLGAESERRFDSYEDLAHGAVMQRIANNKKKLSQDDLFSRPKSSLEHIEKDIEIKSQADKMKEQQELLSRLNF